MKFSKVQFVYIDIDYLKAMNEADSEIFYDENNKEYKFKPHLGMLINQGICYSVDICKRKT